jgi:hypothetical protein
MSQNELARSNPLSRDRKRGSEVIIMKLLYWTPRILCIAFAAFISLFALDVFSESRGLGETLLALMVHLIPTFLILAVLAVSWRREWIGSVLFLGLAAVYYWMTRGRFPLGTYMLISGPLVIMSVLFFLSWKVRTH